MGGITAAEAFAGLGLSATEDLALVAVNVALADLLNSSSVGPSGFFNGCESNVLGRCDVYMPTFVIAVPGEDDFYEGGVMFRQPGGIGGPDWSTRGGVSGPENAAQNFKTFGVVSRVSEVPVPAAAWLFSSALLGLGVVKRKRA